MINKYILSKDIDCCYRRNPLNLIYVKFLNKTMKKYRLKKNNTLIELCSYENVEYYEYYSGFNIIVFDNGTFISKYNIDCRTKYLEENSFEDFEIMKDYFVKKVSYRNDLFYFWIC